MTSSKSDESIKDVVKGAEEGIDLVQKEIDTFVEFIRPHINEFHRHIATVAAEHKISTHIVVGVISKWLYLMAMANDVVFDELKHMTALVLTESKMVHDLVTNGEAKVEDAVC